jgi:peroxiredoxin
MRRGARLVLILAVVAAIVLTLASCAPGESADSPGYVSGDGTVTEWAVDQRDVPLELSGTDFAGNVVDISDFHGQVVLVNTWYAACPPCRAEAPDLVELDALEGVQVVGVNSRDDAGTAQAFERTFGVQYPSIDDASGEATAQLQGVVAIQAVPTTLVLDPQGRIAARVIGRVESSTLRALVDGAAR